MRAAIHQPDFMPWLGFFHKLSLVDTFIVFDHVQISMGKSWSSRNRVLLKEAPVWLTAIRPHCKILVCWSSQGTRI